jgi:hypothetical protein
VILLFVDGLGWGVEDPRVNPVHSGVCPRLESWINTNGVPIDALMGVPGVPQSATGQTAIFTGIHAAAEMGRHIEGFLGDRLKRILREENVFKKLAARGLTSTFANAYFVDRIEEVISSRFQSATTVSALAAFGEVRDKAFLERNEAVYQDLTRETLRSRGYLGPLVSPGECARHLAAIAGKYSLTLFEYFQTDRAGHAGDSESVVKVLSLFDAFLGTLIPLAAAGGMLLALVSDHGNIEDATQHGHTLNPVPFVAAGPDDGWLRRRVYSITEVTPALLEWFERRRVGTTRRNDGGL